MYPLEDIFISNFAKNITENPIFCSLHDSKKVIIKKCVEHLITQNTKETKPTAVLRATELKKIQIQIKVF